MKERCILHCDANCFYASVETVLNPDLRGKAMAVCGSTEERHGIVLAKSEKAKKAGVIVTDNKEFNDLNARLDELRESEKKYFELEVKGLLNEQMKKNHTRLVGEMLTLEDRRKELLTRNIEVSTFNRNLKKIQAVLKTAKPMKVFDPKVFDLFVQRILVMDRNNLIYELACGHKVKVEVVDYYKTRDEIGRVYVTE